MAKESTSKVFLVAFSLCLGCSLLVSAAAVGLKPIQERNKVLEVKENILRAAGIMEEGKSVDELFGRIEARIVDLATGEYVEGVDPAAFDQRKAAKDPAQSVAVPKDKDIGGIASRAKYAKVYLLSEDGALKRVILPIHGKGLWSTLHGFIALDPDGSTIQSLGFYEHAETPGLGGEIDNPGWKQLWVGKKAYRDDFTRPAIEVVKGKVAPDAANRESKVDGLAGATLTGRGVSNLVRYWLGEDGFAPYLAKIRQGGQHG